MPPDSAPRLPVDRAAAPPPSVEALLAAQDWGDLTLRVTRYAFVLLDKRSWETAEDIAQEAVTRVLDPAYAPWDPERDPDVFDFLGRVASGLVANHRRKTGRARTVAIREDTAYGAGEDEPRDPRAHADDEREQGPPDDAVVLRGDDAGGDALGDDPRAADAMAEVRAQIAGDALVLGLLDLIQSGEGKPAKQARLLGASVRDIYLAKRRLMHHVRTVATRRKKGES